MATTSKPIAELSFEFPTQVAVPSHVQPNDIFELSYEIKGKSGRARIQCPAFYLPGDMINFTIYEFTFEGVPAGTVILLPGGCGEHTVRENHPGFLHSLKYTYTPRTAFTNVAREVARGCDIVSKIGTTNVKELKSAPLTDRQVLTELSKRKLENLQNQVNVNNEKSNSQTKTKRKGRKLLREEELHFTDWGLKNGSRTKKEILSFKENASEDVLRKNFARCHSANACYIYSGADFDSIEAHFSNHPGINEISKSAKTYGRFAGFPARLDNLKECSGTFGYKSQHCICSHDACQFRLIFEISDEGQLFLMKVQVDTRNAISTFNNSFHNHDVDLDSYSRNKHHATRFVPLSIETFCTIAAIGRTIGENEIYHQANVMYLADKAAARLREKKDGDVDFEVGDIEDRFSVDSLRATLPNGPGHIRENDKIIPFNRYDIVKIITTAREETEGVTRDNDAAELCTYLDSLQGISWDYRTDNANG